MAQGKKPFNDNSGKPDPKKKQDAKKQNAKKPRRAGPTKGLLAGMLALVGVGAGATYFIFRDLGKQDDLRRESEARAAKNRQKNPAKKPPKKSDGFKF